MTIQNSHSSSGGNGGNSLPQEALAWANEHGSWRLKRAIERGYKSQGIYLRERLAHELPGFTLDASKSAAEKECINPTEQALSHEEKVLRLLELGEIQAQAHLVWLATAPEWDGDPMTTYLWTGGEAVRVTGWLGKYTAYSPVPKGKTPVTVEPSQSYAERQVQLINASRKLGYKSNSSTVITLYSPSGGVGKQTVAHNFATQMSRTLAGRVHGGRVLLLDGDMVQGNLMFRLQVHPNNLVESLFTMSQDQWPVSYSESGEGTAMESLAFHNGKETSLDAIGHYDDFDVIDNDEDYYYALLARLKQFYDVIIIDAGTEVALPHNRAWLTAADQIFFVTTPDIDRLFNLEKSMSYIKDFAPQAKDSTVIVNNASGDRGLDIPAVIAKCFRWARPIKPTKKVMTKDFIAIQDCSERASKAANTNKLLLDIETGYAEKMQEMIEVAISKVGR